MTCFECGNAADHHHHVVPKCRGGTQTVPLCTSCHAAAHHRDKAMATGALTSEAMQRLADENRYTGTVPYGYRLCEDGEHVEPDPAEQEIIRSTLELRASGLTYRAISARLEDEGYVNRKGNPFGPSSIGNIIKNNDLNDFTDHEEGDAPTQGRGGASEGKAAPTTGANPANDTDEHEHQTASINHQDHEEDTDGVSRTGNIQHARGRETHRPLREDDPTPREKRTAERSGRRRRAVSH